MWGRREIHDEGVRRRARQRSRSKRVALFRAHRLGRAPLAPVGGYLLILLGVWLLATQWLHPYTVVGQNTTLRDTGFSVVTLLCGLRLRHRRSPVASVVSLVAGFLLVLSGFLLPHAGGGVGWNEVVVGLLAVLAGALTFGSRR